MRAPPLRMIAHHEGFGDQLARTVPRRDQPLAPRRRRARSAFRTAHACPPPARARSRAHAAHWAADCRSPRSRGRRAAPRRTRRPWRCRAPRPPLARATSREAMASMSQSSPRCIAGITFSVAILATPSTPHLTMPWIPPLIQASSCLGLGRSPVGLPRDHPARIFGLQRADAVEFGDFLGAQLRAWPTARLSSSCSSVLAPTITLITPLRAAARRARRARPRRRAPRRSAASHR